MPNFKNRHKFLKSFMKGGVKIIEKLIKPYLKCTIIMESKELLINNQKGGGKVINIFNKN